MDGNILDRIPLFHDLAPEQRQGLAALFELRHVESQKPVVWIGELGDEFYLIQSGRVSVCYPDADGKETTLAVLGANNFFGEISLLDGGPRTATVRTLEPTDLLVLGRDAFHQFVRQNPEAAVRMMTVLGHRQRETVDKLRGIRNANEAVSEQTTRWHRLTETIAKMASTELFVTINIVVIVTWVAYSLIAGKENAFDPIPFDILAFITGIEGMVLSLFVLISQNREGDRDRISADLDYQVNLKAHLEIMGLHQKMDRMMGRIESVEKRLAAGDDQTDLPGGPS